MKKKILLRLIFAMVLLHAIGPPLLEAYVTIIEIKADELEGWLGRNKIKVKAEDRNTSWRFVLICPPDDVKELEWGVLLQLKTKGTSVAEVPIKPRSLTKDEAKSLEGSLAFEFTFSKDLLEDSTIMMYLEQKVPASPMSQPHIYQSIKLKELLAVRSGLGKPIHYPNQIKQEYAI